MKIAGKAIVKNPLIVEVYIPRGEDGTEGLLLKSQGVTTMDRFDEMVEEPKPMTLTVPGKEPIEDENLGDYKEKRAEYNKLRWAYFLIESLKATEELEWETITDDDPSTWGNITTELEEAGFTPSDIQRISDNCLKANSMDEEHIRIARERFLAGTEAEVE